MFSFGNFCLSSRPIHFYSSSLCHFEELNIDVRILFLSYVITKIDNPNNAR